MIWNVGIESFVQAIVISVLGTIAVDVASGIWREMTPSVPAAFAHAPVPQGESSSRWNLWSSFQQHRFGILFCLLFVLKAWGRSSGQSALSADKNGRSSRFDRIGRQLSENWFGLIVGNAFGALISAMVLVWVQQFSFWHWVRRFLFDSLSSSIHEISVHIFGSGNVGAIGSWFAWYGNNQLKLTFWAFYFAAICDDLGIPNLKTFGRWWWRRLRKRAENQSCCG